MKCLKKLLYKDTDTHFAASFLLFPSHPIVITQSSTSCDIILWPLPTSCSQEFLIRPYNKFQTHTHSSSCVSFPHNMCNKGGPVSVCTVTWEETNSQNTHSPPSVCISVCLFICPYLSICLSSDNGTGEEVKYYLDAQQVCTSLQTYTSANCWIETHPVNTPYRLNMWIRTSNLL